MRVSWHVGVGADGEGGCYLLPHGVIILSYYLYDGGVGLTLNDIDGERTCRTGLRIEVVVRHGLAGPNANVESLALAELRSVPCEGSGRLIGGYGSLQIRHLFGNQGERNGG